PVPPRSVGRRSAALCQAGAPPRAARSRRAATAGGSRSPLRHACLIAALRGRAPGPALSADPRREQLIHPLGVGAAVRALHYLTDEHALQPLLTAEISGRFLRRGGQHLIDPCREPIVVADFEQAVALGDAARRVA